MTAYAETDVERVRSVFTWLASIDLSQLEENIDPDQVPEPQTPLDYLLKIAWNMGNHAFLFAVLVRYSELHT